MDDLSPAELREVKKAIKAAYERGRAAERKEFDAFLARMRALKELNGSGDAFLKAYADRETPRGERRPDPHAAVAEAMLAHAEEAMADGDDHLPGVEALRALLDDPAGLGRVLSDGGADDETVGKAVWSVLKAYNEADHPRSKNGRFISKDRIDAAKSDPKLAKKLKEEVKPEDAGKLDAALEGKTDLGRTVRGEARHRAGQRRATREEAKAKTAKFLSHLKRVGDLKAKLTADDLHDLADHLGDPHVTIDDVRAMRRALAGAGAGRASFGGAKAKDDMVKALQAHAKRAAFEARMKEHGIEGADAEDMRAAAGLGVKEETPAPAPAERTPPATGGQYGAWGRAAAGEATPPGPAAKPKKPRAPKKKVARDTVLSVVQQFGGIDPNSVAFRGHYSNMANAVEDNIPVGVFRKGGRGLDQLAQELHTARLITVPENRDAGEYLLELIRKRAHTHAADLSAKYDEALDEHYRLLQEADGHPDRPAVAEALRLGEEAGRTEGEEGARGGYGGGVEEYDDQAADDSDLTDADTSFDFGANVEPAPPAPPPAPPAGSADAEYRDDLERIPRGGNAYVGGHLVRRLKDGRFQWESKGKNVTGTAEVAHTSIQRAWANQAHERAAIDSALARHAAHAEPDPFADPGAADEAARRKFLVPDGARAVSLDDATRGRTGTVRRDPETGQSSLVLDGGQIARATDWEPLSEKHSWRVPARAAQPERGLFDEPAPAPTEPSPASGPDLSGHQTITHGKKLRVGQPVRGVYSTPSYGDRPFTGVVTGHANEQGSRGASQYGMYSVKLDPGSELAKDRGSVLINTLPDGTVDDDRYYVPHPSTSPGAPGPQPAEPAPEVATASPVDKPVRFEAGKKLTPAERDEVLRSVRDVYRENGLKKDELKGYHRDSGDPIYGYPHAPEHFVRSDVTGAKVRHYVTLPDGRKAHPSELFPQIKQSDIDRHHGEQEAAARDKERRAQAKDARVAATKGDANAAYNVTRRPLSGSYFARHADGRIARVDGTDPEDVQHYRDRGFVPITEPLEQSAPEPDLAGSAPPPPAPPPAPQNPPTQVDTQPPAGNTTPTPATGTGGTVGGGKVGIITRDEARKIRDDAIAHETGGREMSPERLTAARGHVRGLLEQSREAVRARGELTDRVGQRYAAALANVDKLTPAFFYDGELAADPTGEFPTIGGQNLVHVVSRGAK